MELLRQNASGGIDIEDLRCFDIASTCTPLPGSRGAGDALPRTKRRPTAALIDALRTHDDLARVKKWSPSGGEKNE